MSEWSIFGLGVLAGVVWFGCSILAAAWFSQAKSYERIRRDETGTEAPVLKTVV